MVVIKQFVILIVHKKADRLAEKVDDTGKTHYISQSNNNLCWTCKQKNIEVDAVEETVNQLLKSLKKFDLFTVIFRNCLAIFVLIDNYVIVPFVGVHCQVYF